MILDFRQYFSNLQISYILRGWFWVVALKDSTSMNDVVLPTLAMGKESRARVENGSSVGSATSTVRCWLSNSSLLLSVHSNSSAAAETTLAACLNFKVLCTYGVFLFKAKPSICGPCYLIRQLLAGIGKGEDPAKVKNFPPS